MELPVLLDNNLSVLFQLSSLCAWIDISKPLRKSRNKNAWRLTVREGLLSHPTGKKKFPHLFASCCRNWIGSRRRSRLNHLSYIAFMHPIVGWFSYYCDLPASQWIEIVRTGYSRYFRVIPSNALQYMVLTSKDSHPSRGLNRFLHNGQHRWPKKGKIKLLN